MRVDNFTLEQSICLAKYQLRIQRQLVPLRRKPALSFGGVMHYGLAEWYRTRDYVKALQSIHEHWPEVMPSDDFRNEAYALKVMASYVQYYPEESWRVLETPDGKLIEKTFTLDTGLMLDQEFWADDPDGGHILYGGIIDLGIEFGDMLYVGDHKTTTKLGKEDSTYFFMKFKPDNQMTGYIWGLSKLTNRRVGGAYVNALGLYKSGETRFKRYLTARNQFEIDEWLRGVRDRCNRIKRAEKTGEFPMETSQCMVWGACEYYDVHILNDPVSRARRLESDYVKSEWNYEDRDD